MKRRLLILSDGIMCYTGFSTVTKELCYMLRDEYEIGVIGLQKPTYKKIPIEGVDTFNVKNSPTEVRMIFRNAVRTFSPDIVITIQDLWNISWIADDHYSRDWPWIAYFPVDSEPYPNKVNLDGYRDIRLHQIAKNIDHVVAYNDFGKDALESIGVKVDTVIHHSVDTDSYYHDDTERKEMRRKLRCDDKTRLYLAVGVNMVRKGWDQLIKGWKYFQNEYSEYGAENARLHIYTSHIKRSGWDIPELIKSLGVEKSVTLPPSQMTDVNSSYMRRLYNACDYLVSTSMAEGFGLPLLEAVACKKPVVYVNYAGPKTVFKGCGVAIKPVSYMLWHTINSKFAVTSSKDIAWALCKVHNANNEGEFDTGMYELIEKHNRNVIGLEWKKYLSTIKPKGISLIKY